MSRKPLLPIIVLLLAATLVPAGSARAMLQPTSDLLLPYFEVELGAPGPTTLFAVGNAHQGSVDVIATVHTNWGIPVASTAFTLQRDELRTVNLRDWLTQGKFPGAPPLAAAELAHLQAALSGRQSPKDGLYYATEIAPNRAAGYVTLRAQGSRPDALWGDFFVVDTAQDFAQGDNLVDIGRANACRGGLCRRHAVRFLDGGGFDGGTEVVIWTDRRGTPSREPGIANQELVFIASGAYDEPGRHIDARDLRLLPVEKVAVSELGLSAPFGWLDLTTDTESFVGVSYSAYNRYALALQSWCLPIELVIGPGITIRKLTNGDDANQAPGPSIAVGSPVLWEYLVTNVGDVPLNDVRVTDDQGVAVSCPKDTLASGEAMTCSAHGIAVACQYRNLGTATGTPPVGPDVSDEDPSHYFGTQGAAIAIEKATNGQDADVAPGPTIEVGDPVQWTYVVTNTGDVKLTSVTVSDDQGVAVSCPKATLQPGESMTCTGNGVAKPGQYRNVGTAQGTPPCGAAVSADDPSHYFGRHEDPSLELQKLTNGQDADLPPGPSIPVGAPVLWEYLVTNTGGVVVNDIAVSDDQGVAVSCPKTTLQPGESMRCTGSGVARACQYSNLGTATGRTPSGAPLTAQDPSHYFGQAAAAIGIKKATNGDDADAAPGPKILVGAAVHWTYVVTNTGNVQLTNVTVSDDQGVVVSCPKTTLQPGESMTCTGNGVAKPGQYRNVGTARGTPPCGAVVSDDDPSHYYGEEPPPPPPPGGEGCTPGYWKNHTDSWPPSGYATSQTVQSVFAQASGYPGLGAATLHEALSFDGGSTIEGAAEILLRAAVAGLLDSAHPGVDYPRATAALIADVDAALASRDRDRDQILGLASAIDRDNNLGCPLN